MERARIAVSAAACGLGCQPHAQLDGMGQDPNEEVLPALLKIRDTKVVVVAWSVLAHSGGLQKPERKVPSLSAGHTSREWIAPITFHAA